MIKKEEPYKINGGGNNMAPPTTTKLLTDTDIDSIVNHYSLLKNQQYLDIIYVILKKGYVYYKELLNIKGINWRHYISHLVEKDILIKIKINNDIKFYLKSKNGMGNSHIKNMSCYGLSKESYNFYSKDEVLFYIQDKVSNNIIEKVEKDIQDYNDVFENEKQRIINDKRTKELRLKILLQKTNKNGIDYANIQMLQEELK